MNIGDNYYLPRRCLIKIKESEIYPKEFTKHFILSTVISEFEANKLNKKEDKKSFNSFPVFDEIKEKTNPLIDTHLDIELAEYVKPILRKYQYKNKSIPDKIMQEILKRKKEADAYRDFRL